MSNFFINRMTSAQKLGYLAAREQIFGWRREHRGFNFDVHSPEFAQQAATQLIALGQKNGLLSRAGTDDDAKLVQYCLDSRAMKGAWNWVNSPECDRDVQGAHSIEIRTPPVEAQPVEHLVNMARRHSAHGFRGDPKKETMADDGSDVLALAAAVGLKGFTQQESNANDNRPSVDDDGSDVLELAAAVSLKGFVKQISLPTNATDDDGSDVVALAQKHGLKGFTK